MRKNNIHVRIADQQPDWWTVGWDGEATWRSQYMNVIEEKHCHSWYMCPDLKLLVSIRTKGLVMIFAWLQVVPKADMFILFGNVCHHYATIWMQAEFGLVCPGSISKKGQRSSHQVINWDAPWGGSMNFERPTCPIHFGLPQVADLMAQSRNMPKSIFH